MHSSPQDVLRLVADEMAWKLGARWVLVVLGVTVWYLGETRHTMLGNSWQSVAQVASDLTPPLFWARK